MGTFQPSQSSRRIISAILRTEPLLLRPSMRPLPATFVRHRTPRRHASDTTGASKQIVLEQPDKFRPPSHPQRLSHSRPKAYNQGTTEREREAQQHRKYPHMFPKEGTGMHWFLTNRWIHMWITVGTLTLLALFSLTQSFLQTSPYGHLMPPLSSLPFHPFDFISESWSVFRLHMEYTTAQTAESRRQNIMDAQKRRIYRRAHGIEDLTQEEDEGVDVRGLVPWDDGLTPKERAQGGRWKKVTGRDVIAMGGQVGEDIEEFVKRKKAEKAAAAAAAENGTSEGGTVLLGQGSDQSGGGVQAEGASEITPQPTRKRKLWFGIW